MSGGACVNSKEFDRGCSTPSPWLPPPGDEVPSPSPPSPSFSCEAFLAAVATSAAVAWGSPLSKSFAKPRYTRRCPLRCGPHSERSTTSKSSKYRHTTPLSPAASSLSGHPPAQSCLTARSFTTPSTPPRACLNASRRLNSRFHTGGWVWGLSCAAAASTLEPLFVAARSCGEVRLTRNTRTWGPASPSLPVPPCPAVLKIPTEAFKGMSIVGTPQTAMMMSPSSGIKCDGEEDSFSSFMACSKGPGVCSFGGAENGTGVRDPSSFVSSH
mmetsp:Transcript_1243/g.2661  ORF Transcript_1243/g.2661 Transcript_1243/m.2661 type:complete len:270 (-) Transcript_1243:230-1039(-)